MFLALRDIRFAKGRFSLMTAVVALVTLLIVLISALTKGLETRNTSALDSLGQEAVALAPMDGKTDWSESVISAGTVHLSAIPQSAPLTIARARVEHASSSSSLVTFTSTRGPSVSEHGIVLPDESAQVLGVDRGATVTINGQELLVEAVEPARWYSHSPVAWVSPTTAAALTHRQPDDVTALLLDDAEHGRDAAEASGLVVLDRGGWMKSLPGYDAERGSLVMIQGFLYGITALVVLAFLSVWTIQRTRDIAVLRAIGASRRYVLRDSLGQAAVLLAFGSLLGGVLGAALALLVRSVAPVEVTPQVTVIPALTVALVGLLGSLIATRRVASVNPQLALGGN